MWLISTLVAIGIVFLLVVFITNPVIDSSSDDDASLVQVDRLRRDVRFLTSISPPRNSKNIDSLNKVAEYIYTEFEKTGCSLIYQPFQIEGKEYKNVICSFGPVDAARVIVGAHYDVHGDSPGADDNASGVAGVLDLSRLIAEQKPLLNYRIDLVAYANEELPYFGTKSMGSMVHAQSLQEAKAPIKLMISLEMIGYFRDEVDSQRYPSPLMRLLYPSKGNFIAVVGNTRNWLTVRRVKQLVQKSSPLPVYSINAPSFIRGVTFSDHASFWRHGYDAVMISDTAFYRNQNYHLPTDTIDTLDFERMAEVVRGVYYVVTPL